MLSEKRKIHWNIYLNIDLSRVNGVDTHIPSHQPFFLILCQASIIVEEFKDTGLREIDFLPRLKKRIKIGPNHQWLFPFLFLKGFIFQRFRFTTKLQRRYRNFPYSSCPQTCIASLIIISHTRILHVLLRMNLQCHYIITGSPQGSLLVFYSL